ncbi:MAG: helix-turn-helix transcriptional regulator [Amphiplicatus sp.]
MWRSPRIAHVGAEGAGIRLGRMLGRLGLQEQIDIIADDEEACLLYKEDRLDIIIIDATGAKGPRLSYAKKLRCAFAESLLMLTAVQIDKNDVAALVNEARLDWILPPNFSDVDLKEALVWAMTSLEERRRAREDQLGRNLFNAVRMPAAILDRSYHVVFANEPAERLFRQGDPFLVTCSDQLVCLDSAATQIFHEELRSSLHKHLKDTQNALIRIERQDGRKPVVVASIPRQDSIDSRHTYHLIFNDLENQIEASPEAFSIALGLSAAEARLVQALSRGLDLESASSEINISVSTARSYLKSIFEKTGVTRQAELIRLALLAVR